MTSGLLIAQLALYAPLTLPTLYLLYRHGHHGLLAWLYLLAFCVLRVTGAAMGLNDPHNAGSRIISSIGLSPLLLSIDGVLHEARIYCLSPSKRTEWTFMALIHVLVATGVAMVGVGAGGLLGDTPKPSDLSNIKVGMVLLEVSWGVLALWGLWTLWNGTGGGRKSARNQGAQAGLAAREGWLIVDMIVWSGDGEWYMLTQRCLETAPNRQPPRPCPRRDFSGIHACRGIHTARGSKPNDREFGCSCCVGVLPRVARGDCFGVRWVCDQGGG
ncbi:integral membrane protein [Aspergillus fumigatus A1163]|uniref:Integral membrane protein n=1 Tax=Aspergillus fumigatus (strain CBS 144.89 / FGSC A1163 / CEA10) TaxID=451804 RepID=B0Y564_ASPFC|nr:integral membrane protein [Aspergillus fumigatus A1163]